MEIFKSNFNKDSFWEQLLLDTNQFQEAALYSNVLNTDFNYDSIFKNFFQKFKSDKQFRESSKIRIYVNGGKNDASLIQLQKNPPLANEKLKDWGESLFEGKPWCIVLDKVSGLIEELTLPIATWSQSLISNQKPGSMVLDISPYIGRYGYTPFGAHIDVPGISVLHLHLGPNKKEMTIWNAEEFQKLSGSNAQICHDFKPLLSKGKTFSIEPGDIFHLPAGTHYHIGKADEFSVGLTIGLKREDSKSLMYKAIKEHKRGEAGIVNSDIIETYRIKKSSNAGFMKTPLIKTASVSDLIDRKLRIKRPFKLILDEKKGLTYGLYIRGRYLSMPISEAEKKCIELLNEGKEITLTAEFFNTIKLDENVGLELMVKLYNYGGITLL